MSTIESRTFLRLSKRRSRNKDCMASFPSTSPAWMFAWMYAIGRLSRLASAGVDTSGRDAMTYGSSRPSIVLPIEPVTILAPRILSESMKATTSS